jgi:hypothetical protein
LHKLNGLSSSREPNAPARLFIDSSRVFRTWDRQSDLFSFGESVSATSSLSVERTLLGHPPTQVRCGLPGLPAIWAWRNKSPLAVPYKSWTNLHRFQIWWPLNSGESKGTEGSSREIRGMMTCYIYMLLTRRRRKCVSRDGKATEIWADEGSTLNECRRWIWFEPNCWKCNMKNRVN